MRENFGVAFNSMIKHEGGFVNHPKDPGGMTNLGVTKKVWDDWTGGNADEQEMRSLTPDKVAPLYKKRYWDAIKGDDLPSGIDLCVFDCAVNSGVSRAVRILQRILGVKDDGVIGPVTISAVTAIPVDDLIERYSEERQDFLESLPTFSVFGKGWTTRVSQVETQSKAIV
jgi:lysozyme family protein